MSLIFDGSRRKLWLGIGPYRINSEGSTKNVFLQSSSKKEILIIQTNKSFMIHIIYLHIKKSVVSL